MDGPGRATVDKWLQTLKESASQTAKDDPNYWISNPEPLCTDSVIESLAFGTGHSIYTNTILPAIADAEQEVILVTCFWARSGTLDALNQCLINLSAKALARGKKIRTRICMSSFGFFSKLFHTRSLEGQRHEPKTWRSKFGLPAPEELEGLEMKVKSIFILPFSVMHPKFVVIDRKRVLLPSCNVSWERWFEGCVGMSGAIVERFLTFYQRFWARDEDLRMDANGNTNDNVEEHGTGSGRRPSTESKPESFWWSKSALGTKNRKVPSLFLPSPHRRNPRFSLLLWRLCPRPPPTPLNTFLLTAFANARKSIFIQTPNLTAPPVLSALLQALDHGVNVTIVTSERLMLLEQLITAGTTTKRCLNKLVKRHKQLLRREKQKQADWTDGETGSAQPGRLRTLFFQPDPTRDPSVEPTQSHFKFITLDDEWSVFGSGNMDRASWYTSQELGVAFNSGMPGEQTLEFSRDVQKLLGPTLENRTRLFYDDAVEGQERSDSLFR